MTKDLLSNIEPELDSLYRTHRLFGYLIVTLDEQLGPEPQNWSTFEHMVHLLNDNWSVRWWQLIDMKTTLKLFPSKPNLMTEATISKAPDGALGYNLNRILKFAKQNT